MKINKIINRLDNKKILKKKFTLKGKKNSKVSTVHYDSQQGLVNILNLQGTCLKLRQKGLNTKLEIQGYLKPTTFRYNFFIYSPQFLDVKFH